MKQKTLLVTGSSGLIRSEVATHFDALGWHSMESTTINIDASKHSLFGASKVAADVMVQEYGRYFGMPTCCLRGGCLTGPAHAGVELPGS